MMLPTPVAPAAEITVTLVFRVAEAASIVEVTVSPEVLDADAEESILDEACARLAEYVNAWHAARIDDLPARDRSAAPEPALAAPVPQGDPPRCAIARCVSRLYLEWGMCYHHCRFIPAVMEHTMDLALRVEGSTGRGVAQTRARAIAHVQERMNHLANEIARLHAGEETTA